MVQSSTLLLWLLLGFLSKSICNNDAFEELDFFSVSFLYDLIFITSIIYKPVFLQLIAPKKEAKSAIPSIFKKRSFLLS